MYAIACILSYDGLSSISPDDDAFDSQATKLDAADRNKSAGGRKGFGYITPGPYLRSLMSDNARATSSHSNNVRGSMPNGPPRGFQHQKPGNKSQIPLHGRSGAAAATAGGGSGGGGGGGPRSTSFKRRRPGKG